MKNSSAKLRQRKGEALRRFLKDTSITPFQIEQAPQITDILKASLKSPKNAIQALRFSNEPLVQTFLEEYDRIPEGDKASISIEAICVKASVSPASILGAALMSWKLIKSQEAALTAIHAFPGVVKDMVKFSKLPGGDKDRKLLGDAVGFLPTPKGGSNFAVNILNGNPQLSKEVSKDEEDDFGFIFPSVGRNLEMWSEARRKLLSDGK